MRTPHPARLRLLLTLSCLLVAAACGNEPSARSVRSARAAAQANRERAVVGAANPERFAELLRARYGAERACLEQRFPATVIQSPGDSSRSARLTDEQYVRPYEVLRGAGLLTRDEVRPGEHDWKLPARAYVDSGGRNRIVRYTLTGQARRDAERSDGGEGERLCYARRRLVSVDDVDARGPSPSWTPGDGVRYSQAVVFVGHVIAFDSVAPWASAVARRDAGSDFGMLRPALLDGPQHRWAEFWLRNGAWMYVGTQRTAPP